MQEEVEGCCCCCNRVAVAESEVGRHSRVATCNWLDRVREAFFLKPIQFHGMDYNRDDVFSLRIDSFVVLAKDHSHRL